MLSAGLRARLTCLDPRVLPPSFGGREFDAALLRDLPDGVDPCGERGEFHTFAFAGPMFDAPVAHRTGLTIERDGFVFTDLQVIGPDASADPARICRDADSSAPA
jgi:diphthamide synthase (EF-2-diphthine--ammonia ligase)